MVSNENSKIIYNGDGTTTTFPFNFYIFQDSDLVVVLRDKDSGAETVQTLNSDYTVTGAGNESGGNVVFTSAPSSDYYVVIYREVDLTQETDYVENDNFSADSHERALDKLTMITQQLNEKISRAVLQNITETTPLELPELSSGKYLYTDGSALSWESVSTTNAEVFWVDASDYSSLSAAISAIGSLNRVLLIKDEQIISSDLTIPSNICLLFIRPGKITIQSGVTLTLNGCYIYADRYQIFDNSGTIAGTPYFIEAYPEWFGAVGDGTTDDISAFGDLSNIATNRVVSLKDSATYKLTDSFLIPEGCTVLGNNSKLLFVLSGAKRGVDMRSYTSINDVEIEVNGTPTGGGMYYNCIVIGNSETNVGYHDINIKNVILKSTASGYNLLSIFAESYNIVIDGVRIPENAYSAIGIMTHFGGSDFFPGNVWDGVNYCNYPHNIVIRNIECEGMTVTSAEIIRISGGYNILIENVFANNVQRVFHYTIGNPGYDFTDPTQRDVMGTGIIVRNVSATDVKHYALHVDGTINTVYGATTGFRNSIRFENINIQGDSTATTGFGLVIDDAREVNVINCEFANLYNSAIRFNDGAHNCLIDKCYIHDIGYSGIWQDAGTNAHYNTITNSRIELCNKNGSSTTDQMCLLRFFGDYWVIRDCILGGSGETASYGIRVDSGGDHTLIENVNVLELTSGGSAFYVDSSAAANRLIQCYVAPSITFINSNPGSGNIIIQRLPNTIISFADGDTTPSVAEGSIFKTANTAPTTITMFDGGYEGKVITVIFGDSNTTIDFTSTNLKGNNGADWTPGINDSMTCVFDGTNWYCDISNN